MVNILRRHKKKDACNCFLSLYRDAKLNLKFNKRAVGMNCKFSLHWWKRNYFHNIFLIYLSGEFPFI